MPGEGALLTSQLETIEAATTEDSVAVAVMMWLGQPSGQPKVVFQTRVWAFDGVVRVNRLDDVVELEMRRHGLWRDTVRISIGEAQISRDMIHCTHTLPEDYDPADSFMTATESAMVHGTSVIHLCHLPNAEAHYTVKAVGLGKEGMIASVERTLERIPTEDALTVTVEDITAMATEGEDGLRDVRFFGIGLGGAWKYYTVGVHPHFLRFRYRNIFNAWEEVDVTGLYRHKRVKEYKEAERTRLTLLYDQKVRHSYEVTTGPLTDDQATTIAEMIMSHEAVLVTDTQDYAINITDHTAETDNDPDTLPTMKFTFALKAHRPAVLPGEMSALTPTRPRIFTKEYTHEYQ